MAEGWGRALKGEKYNFFSAGTKKHGMNPWAVKVMQEVGIDISKHQSKKASELGNAQMEYVFTVCPDACENRPAFPGSEIVHVGFDDPPRLAKGMQDEEEILQVYRRVRDEIKDFVNKIEQYLV